MDYPDRKSFKQLTISVEKLPDSMARQAEISSYAAERARLLLGCYRTGDANDPETYVAAITAVLSRYSMPTITAVTHPVSGLPVEVKWLPSVSEVREACERAELPIRNQEAREKRIAAQMAERRQQDQEADNRPTYEYLKAKYMPNFGITDATVKTGKTPEPAPTVDQLRHHYQHYGLSWKPKKSEDAA